MTNREKVRKPIAFERPIAIKADYTGCELINKKEKGNKSNVYQYN